ncbi:hypothetical protein KR059_010880 [Drosophila kikkawai]|nr:hypothetical protein KR059_010880 [Drosophila kikkawai]
MCRRREEYQEERKRSLGYQQNGPARKQVAEIIEDHLVEDAEEFSEGELEGDEIEALALVCWNCRKEGHRYQDCGGKRKIFCYGCGAPNTYKPSCGKCQQKNSMANTQPRQLMRVRRPQSNRDDNQ